VPLNEDAPGFDLRRQASADGSLQHPFSCLFCLSTVRRCHQRPAVLKVDRKRKFWTARNAQLRRNERA
jgi:hypothetical protein